MKGSGVKSELFGFKAPKEVCTDQKCPYHGGLQVKPELLEGVIVRKDLNRSATISWFRLLSVPKYERYEVRRSRLRVHNPGCLAANIGDTVVVARTRPLSKTKNHVIIGKIEGKSNKIMIAEEASHQDRRIRVKDDEEAESASGVLKKKSHKEEDYTEDKKSMPREKHLKKKTGRETQEEVDEMESLPETDDESN